jgi:hypothetical protein
MADGVGKIHIQSGCISRVASPYYLHCVVGPDPMISPLRYRLLSHCWPWQTIEVVDADPARCQRVAWGLLARLA